MHCKSPYNKKFEFTEFLLTMVAIYKINRVETQIIKAVHKVQKHYLKT